MAHSQVHALQSLEGESFALAIFRSSIYRTHCMKADPMCGAVKCMPTRAIVPRNRARECARSAQQAQALASMMFRQ